MITISLVIPAFNEEAFLPRLLESIEAARAAYPRGRDAVEVIVADNCSTDNTALLAERRGVRVVRVDKRAIAAARNGGARAARGDILCFVDADTVRIHPRTFDAIEERMATGRYVGGSTGVSLERWSLGLGLTYAAFLPMVWLTGMDTGVVFCLRKDFESVGGFDEKLLIAEDVAFQWALRRLGRRHGRRLVRLPSVKAVASTRKFDQHGDWHYFALMTRVAFGMLTGRQVATDFIRSYWYQR